ncbi:NADH:flavin oxidoreductase, partial [Candidatus Poribacteria bacterium]|nr:NADH:flavin oxidoreductase [Candidatus Poribacteria bacterium]
EAKANSRQLVINDDTASAIEAMLNLTRNAHREVFGANEEVMVGMQLTHSGRYSYQKPLIAFRHPVVDKTTLIDKKNRIPIPDDYPVLTDDYLERLEDVYVDSAKFAWKMGFDFVDLKQCHTYLLSELLAAKTREGKYGGSFENRTRFIRNIIGKIQAEIGNELILATRLNVYDGVAYMEDPQTTVGIPRDCPIPYPYGFGVDENNPPQEDMTEPIQLVGMLKGLGVKLVNVSMGSPYFNPHIGRPFERPPIDGYETPEHPLIGVDRHIRLTGVIQQAYPDLPVVGTGYSWLQSYLVNAGEANIQDGRVSIVAVGRGALAYPDYAKDTIEHGGMIKQKVCVAVSYCTVLMRAKANPQGQFAAGCVPRDKIYAQIYKEAEKTLVKRKA